MIPGNASACFTHSQYSSSDMPRNSAKDTVLAPSCHSFTKSSIDSGGTSPVRQRSINVFAIARSSIDGPSQQVLTASPRSHQGCRGGSLAYRKPQPLHAANPRCSSVAHRGIARPFASAVCRNIQDRQGWMASADASGPSALCRCCRPCFSFTILAHLRPTLLVGLTVCRLALTLLLFTPETGTGAEF